VYGPLCNGATTVMFESTPVYPDAGRYWDMVQTHKINQFYTAPTAIRFVLCCVVVRCVVVCCVVFRCCVCCVVLFVLCCVFM